MTPPEGGLAERYEAGRAAGGRANDYLAGDALLTGNRVVAAAPAVYPALDAVLGYREHRSPTR